MDKGERISQLVAGLTGKQADQDEKSVINQPFYRAFFHCWNDRQYYEAHDVLEQLWLKTDSDDADFFKGLIQAAGAFVHLKKHYEHPSHAKHGRRLAPAARLFRMAEENLSAFMPRHHGLNVTKLCELLRKYLDQIVASHYTANPWSPETAPKLDLM